MKAKHLIFLIILAAVLGGLAYVTSSRKAKHTAGTELMGKPVLPQLQDKDVLKKIEKMAFATSGQTVTVARADGVWVAPGKYGYPVDFEKAKEFVQALVDLKVGQVMPGGEKQLARLNLLSPESVEPGKAWQSGTLVKMMDSDENVLARLVVGKERMKKADPNSQFGRYGGYPDGRYVAADGKAFLVGDPLSSLPADDKAWLDDELLNLRAGDVMSVSLTDRDGESLTLRRPDENGALEVPDLTEDEEMERSKANNLANLFSYLNFTDVADPSLSDEEVGMDKPMVAGCETKKGKAYTLTIGGSPEDSKNRYVRLSASYDPPPVPEEAPEGDDAENEDEAEKDADEEAKKAAERQAKQAKLAQEVKDFNERVGPWTYLVRSYKFEDLSVDRDDYVKEKEKIAEPDEENEDDEAQAEEETSAADEEAAGAGESAEQDDDTDVPGQEKTSEAGTDETSAADKMATSEPGDQVEVSKEASAPATQETGEVESDQAEPEAAEDAAKPEAEDKPMPEKAE